MPFVSGAWFCGIGRSDQAIVRIAPPTLEVGEDVITQLGMFGVGFAGRFVGFAERNHYREIEPASDPEER